MIILCEFCEIEMIKQEDTEIQWDCYVCPKCNRKIYRTDMPDGRLENL